MNYHSLRFGDLIFNVQCWCHLFSIDQYWLKHLSSSSSKISVYCNKHLPLFTSRDTARAAPPKHACATVLCLITSWILHTFSCFHSILITHAGLALKQVVIIVNPQKRQVSPLNMSVDLCKFVRVLLSLISTLIMLYLGSLSVCARARGIIIDRQLMLSSCLTSSSL